MINLPQGKNTDSPIHFKAGTVIFSEGEKSKYLFIIKNGEVRLLKGQGHHLKVIKNCLSREILNEVSILTNSPIEFSAIAKTDVDLVLIEQKEISAVIHNGPAWIPEIFETLCKRLTSTLEIIEEHNLKAGELIPEMLLSKDDEAKIVNALNEYKTHS